MMRIFWRGLVSGAAAAALLACSPSDKPASPAPDAAGEGAPPAAPALWRVGDADTTVYLFGTVHVLPPELVWRTPGLEAARDEAHAVYFETDIEPDPAALNRIIADFGRYPAGERLTDRLTPDQRDLLERTSRDLDLPLFVIEGLRPWLASLTLAEQLIARAGYDPMSGVERTLHPGLRASGKDIRKLETVEQQLLAFADLPEQVQVDYLVHGLLQVGEENRLLGELVDAWRTGDMDALDRIMLEGDLKDLPEVYDALIVRRNAAWTVTLDRLIAEESGVFVVAVGAGHLVGADSVQTMLAERGHMVERLDPR